MQHLDESVIGQDEAKNPGGGGLQPPAPAQLHPRAGLPTGRHGRAGEVQHPHGRPFGHRQDLLVRTLARILGVPFASADATTLTQAGYVGDDVDSIIARLLEAAGGDVQKAQWGIVYIDEVDKLARRGGGGTAVRDISGEGVQQALLKLVEGSEVRIGKGPAWRTRRGAGGGHPQHLFIAGGAFPEPGNPGRQPCARVAARSASMRGRSSRHRRSTSCWRRCCRTTSMSSG